MDRLRLIAWSVGLVIVLSCPAIQGQDSSSQVAPPVDWAQALQDARPGAINQILLATQSDDPRLRANAIEASQTMPDRALPLVQLAVDDEHLAVRFAALVTVGQLQLHAAVPGAARHMNDAAASVRLAALFALRRCGHDVDITPLADALAGTNATARGNAAMLLGMLKDRSAAPMMMAMAKVPIPRASSQQAAMVRIQIAEAVLTLVEDQAALSALRASMYSPADEVRVMSIAALGKVNDQRMRPAIAKLLDEPAMELQLVAAQSLALMGSREGLGVLLQGAVFNVEDVRSRAKEFVDKARGDPQVGLFKALLADPQMQVRVAAGARAQAAFGLGLIGPDPLASPALIALLDDAVQPVRVAAATAILRAVPPPPKPARAAIPTAVQAGNGIEWIQP